MANSNDVQRAAEKILEDESLISNLTDEEAKALIDWALSELEANVGMSAMTTLDDKTERIRKAMKEINALVGNRQSLVADDLEERMANLLVGDLDPKSQFRLGIEREIAQVTAEKDHISGAELVSRLTQIASKTWSAKAQADLPSPTIPSHTKPAGTSQPAMSTAETQSRPIPRPTKDEPKKRSWLDRLLGRK